MKTSILTQIPKIFPPGTINFDNFWDFWWILLDKWHFDAIRVRSFYTGPLSVSDNVIFIPKSCIFNDLGLF